MTDKERIEVYVNELPECCFICPCYEQDKYHDACNLGRFCIEQDQQKFICRHSNCPLKTIQSVQNQKAVEALEKVKKEVWLPSNYKEAILEEIDQLIKEYGEKDE